MKWFAYLMVIMLFVAVKVNAQDDTFPPQDSTPTQIPVALKVKKNKKVKKASGVKKADNLLNYTTVTALR